MWKWTFQSHFWWHNSRSHQSPSRKPKRLRRGRPVPIEWRIKRRLAPANSRQQPDTHTAAVSRHDERASAAKQTNNTVIVSCARHGSHFGLDASRKAAHKSSVSSPSDALLMRLSPFRAAAAISAALVVPRHFHFSANKQPAIECLAVGCVLGTSVACECRRIHK